MYLRNITTSLRFGDQNRLVEKPPIQSPLLEIWDDFEPTQNDGDMYNALHRLFPHGEQVAAVAVHTNENARLRFIHNEEDTPDGINFSRGIDQDFKTLYCFSGIDATPETLKAKTPEIRNFLKEMYDLHCKIYQKQPGYEEALDSFSQKVRERQSEKNLPEWSNQQISKFLPTTYALTYKRFLLIEKQIQEAKKIHPHFEFTIPGGNNGPKHFNLANFMTGTTGIKSTNAKKIRSPFSADNSLLQQESIGCYNLYLQETPDQIRLAFSPNQQSRADFVFPKAATLDPKSTRYESVKALEKFIRTQHQILSQYTGKESRSVIHSDEAYELIEKKQEDVMQFCDSNKTLNILTSLEELEGHPKDALISVELYAKRKKLTEDSYLALKHLGDYLPIIALNPFVKLDVRHAIFRVNHDGKIYYSPDGSAPQEQTPIYFIEGTSLASPAYLVETLSNKRKA